MGWRYEFEFEEDDRLKEKNKLEKLERIVYLIKEEIENWDTEAPEEWANILSQVQRFLEELEDV